MINRRKILGAAAALGGAALSSVFGLGRVLKAAGKDHKNVLMIVVDDLNDWIGVMGGHPNAKTPHMDALAGEGTLFTRAYANAPLCGPSRASMMTGLRPSTTGIYGHVGDNNIKKANDAAAQATFLSNYFSDHGYKTMGIGKLFHNSAPKGAFDEFGGRVPRFGPYPPKELKWVSDKTNTDWGAFPDRDDEMPDYVSALWTAQRLAPAHNKPFFLACGFLRPHVPWHVPQKWFDMHPVDSIELPPYLPGDMDDVPEMGRRVAEMPMMPTTEWAIETGEWPFIVQAYLASVSFADYCVGIVLNALKKSAYAENTMVILWSDHGYQLGEKNRFAKQALWEDTTHVPLIISTPDGHKGQIRNQPVSLLDIYPTLLDMCDLPPNPQNQGVSLKPLLTNDDANWPHAAVTTYGPNNHSIRTPEYRYIRYEDGSEELYNHTLDDDEWNNIAGEPEMEAVKADFQKYIPTENVLWSPVSKYSPNEYFEGLMSKVRKRT